MKNRKLSKILGLLITLSLICGMIYIPAITSSAADAEVLASFEGEKIKYGRTFEQLTASEVESWYTNDQKTNGGFRSWTENGVVTGYNGGKALSPVYGKTHAERTLEFYPIPEPTSGIQHIRFDYRAGTSEDQNSNIMLVYKSTDKFLAHAISGTTALFGAEWVNVDIVINYEEKSWDVTAVPYNSSIATYINNGTFDGNSLFIKFAYKSSSGSSRTVDNTPAIDNFYWTAEVSAEVLASFEGETVNYGRTFENLTTDEVESWYTNDQKTNGGFRTWTENGIVAGCNSEIALSPVYGRTNAVRTLEFYPIPEPSNGIHHFRFDYKAGTTEDKSSNIMLVYKASDDFLAHAIKDTTALIGAEWFNVDIAINYDEKVWNVTAVPYNGSIATYTNNGTFNGNSLFIKFAYESSDGSSRTADNTPAIDNFYWTTENNVIEPEPDPEPETEQLASFTGETVAFGRTFEKLTTTEVNSWYTDEQKTNGGFRSWTENGVVAGYNSEIAFSPVYGKTNDRSLEFYPIPEPRNGIHHFRFDYKAGTTEDKTSNIMLVYKSNDAFCAHAIQGATALFGEEWVNVDIVINYDTNSWNVTAVPYNSALDTYTNNGTFENGTSLFLKFAYASSSGSSRTADNTPAIDNFYWTIENSSVLSPAPVIKANDIVIKDNGEILQSDWSCVSTYTKTLEISFDVMMDVATLNGDNIYITDKETGLAKNADITVDLYSAVLTLEEGVYLEPGKTYVINITSDVATIGGVNLVKTYTFEFMTDKAKVVATPARVSVDSKAVESFAELKTLSNAVIEIEYGNTTGEDITFYTMICYYSENNALVKSDIYNVQKSKDVYEETISLPYTVSVPDDAVRAKILTWKSFEAKKTLAKGLSIR